MRTFFKILIFIFLLIFFGVIGFCGTVLLFFMFKGIAFIVIPAVVAILYIIFYIWIMRLIFRFLFPKQTKKIREEQKELENIELKVRTLVNYINQGKSQGYKDIEIYKKLENVGWEKVYIDAAFKYLEK